MTALTTSVNFRCSKNDPRFRELLESLEELLNTVVSIAQEEKNVNLALKTFSRSFGKLLPQNINNLDFIDYKKIFIGQYSSRFTIIYSQMVEIWKENQDYLLSYRFEKDKKKLEKNQKEIWVKLKNLQKLLVIFNHNFFSSKNPKK